VLLVDDHVQLLRSVATLLARDFEVAGVATDGIQAVDQAGQLTPDVIVMDVEMPGLDGFQTLQALARGGAPPPVVFLSMHDADEVVSEAFRHGALGYVLKPRVGRDLVHAIDQALLGKSFVPSLVPLVAADRGGHAMLLHKGKESLVEGLAKVVDRGLRRGDAICVIATRPVREDLGESLRAQGWEVSDSDGHKRYRAIDVAEALNTVMRDGLPDPGQLAEVTRELDGYRRAQSESAGGRLIVCGHLSGSLAAAGNGPAALALEGLWNRLTGDLPFLTICGYASSCFHAGAPGLWSGTCAEHRTLTHARDV